MRLDSEGGFQDELRNSNQYTVRTLIYLHLVVTYVWAFWLLYPTNSVPLLAWYGMFVLLISTIAARQIVFQSLLWAAHILSWGSVAAITFAILGFENQILAILYVLPLIVLRQLYFDTHVYGVMVLIVLGIAISVIAQFAFSIPLLLLIGLFVIYQSVVIQHIHVNLELVWKAYALVYQDQKTARTREAELRHVSRQLDEATARYSNLNRKLENALDQAYEATRLKQEFAQNISHELRTPLNLIVGFAELMNDSPEYYGSPLPLTYARDLKVIYRSALHLQSLVNDVLDLARIQAAQMSITPEKTNLIPIIYQAIDTVHSLADVKNLTIHTDLVSSLPEVWVDQTRIRQILLNLLNNAIRFTDEGCITIRAGYDTECVQITVEDTGVGIAPDVLPVVFEAFQQADTPRRGGTGLGLAISKKFVELHGGKIEVESVPGKGTCIFFTIPIDRIETGLLAVGGSPTPLMSPASRSRSLLVVTQSPFALSLLTRRLKEFYLHASSSLTDVFELAQKVMPEAVIVDSASIPIDSDNDLMTCIPPRLLTIVCRLSLPRYQRLGLSGYLIKPVSRETLWNLLRRFDSAIDKVLIIDDDEDFVRLFSRMLDHPVRRMQVIGAYNGREGLELIALYQPQLVFVDLEMPDMHGLEVVEHLRANPVYQDLPVVIVTSQAITDDIESFDGTLSILRPNGLTSAEIFPVIERLLGSV